MKFLGGVLIAVLIVAGVWIFISHRHQVATPPSDTAAVEEAAQGKAKQDINAQIKAFGNVLKNVSLLSPTAATDIEREYAPYVTRSLRTAWSAHPDTALGKTTSSPWPDHIDVIDIDSTPDNVYQVRGMLVYLTSEEVANGGDAGSSEIVFVVVYEDGAWKIDSVSVIHQHAPNTPRDDQDRPQLE